MLQQSLKGIRRTSIPVLAALAGALTFATAAPAQECEPSKWGADDEIGAANLVTPERVMAAAKLIKQGKTHPLGIVVDRTTPAFPPRTLSLQVVQPGQQGGQLLFEYEGNYNDDIAQLWFGIGPQIDGLGHLGEKGMYYNCNSAEEISDITGLKKLGVHNIPPIVARGVLIDMTKHFDVENMEAGQSFNAQDIQDAAEAQNVEIREGDVVLFHTGWTDAMLDSDPTAWVSGEPGQTEDAAEWLASQNVIAVGSDTWGMDVVPPENEGRPFYGHVILLKQNGIYILETMNTGPLAEAGVNEFMFVLGQARIRGTVQMIINPVALY